jgi:AcrR family transcriptional regulator
VLAAAEVFRRKGYQGARMDDIATVGHTDRATLYYYFRNKQELFRAVIIDAVTHNVAEARRIAAGGGSATDRLRALMMSLLDSYQRHYPYMFVYVQEDIARVFSDDSRQGRTLRDLGSEYESIVEGLIAHGLGDGEFATSAPPRIVAYALIGAANWTHRWYDPARELSGAEVGGLFAEIFLEGLRTR